MIITGKQSLQNILKFIICKIIAKIFTLVPRLSAESQILDETEFDIKVCE